VDRREEIGTLATFRARLTIATLLGLVAGCLIVAFAVAPSARKALTFTAAVIAGATGIYSTYYAAANIRGQIELSRKRTALRFIEAWPSEERSKERQALRRINAKELSAHDLVHQMGEDEDLERAARTHLNFIQAMAVAIRSGTADEALLYDYFHLIVEDTMELVKAYISYQREEYRHAEIWIHAEELGTSWHASPSAPRHARS
jgi:hypothetical protein